METKDWQFEHTEDGKSLVHHLAFPRFTTQIVVQCSTRSETDVSLKTIWHVPKPLGSDFDWDFKVLEFYNYAQHELIRQQR